MLSRIHRIFAICQFSFDWSIYSFPFPFNETIGPQNIIFRPTNEAETEEVSERSSSQFNSFLFDNIKTVTRDFGLWLMARQKIFAY